MPWKKPWTQEWKEIILKQGWKEQREMDENSRSGFMTFEIKNLLNSDKSDLIVGGTETIKSAWLPLSILFLSMNI